MATQPTLTLSNAQSTIALPKYIDGNVVWINSPQNSRFFSAFFDVLNNQGETIPGLTVDIHFRKGAIGLCNYKFGLFKFSEGKKLRAYQIEVYPPDQQSHKEIGLTLFGPHQHIGPNAETIPELAHLGCENDTDWFHEFLRRANIEHKGGDYVTPVFPVAPGLQPALF